MVRERSQVIDAQESKGQKFGILLVGHGTRDEQGVADFLATCRRVSTGICAAAVESCFLELCEPSIAVGMGRLIDAGAKRIVVAPILLFAAGHARHDIPQAVTEALNQYPDVIWSQAEHLGCHPSILRQSSARFQEAVANCQPVEKNQTLLLFVGRGSTDEDAIRETHLFAATTPQADFVSKTTVCFYAMATPSLNESLEYAAHAGYRRVVVQPHLLFEGQIAEEIRKRVWATAVRHPQVDWLVTEPLGPTELVAQAIVERAAAAWSES